MSARTQPLTGARRPGVQGRRARTVAVRAGLVAGLLLAAGVVLAVAPVWARILTGLAVVLAWAVCATRPAELSLARHLAALAGQVVLDVARTVLRAVVVLIAAIALAWAAWSWARPRLTAELHDAATHVTSGLTSGLASQAASGLPSLPTLPAGVAGRVHDLTQHLQHAWDQATHPTRHPKTPTTTGGAR